VGLDKAPKKVKAQHPIDWRPIFYNSTSKKVKAVARHLIDSDEEEETPFITSKPKVLKA
jgi:hypothetical protein